MPDARRPASNALQIMMLCMLVHSLYPHSHQSIVYMRYHPRLYKISLKDVITVLTNLAFF